jgi:hypothetical protein
MNLDSKKSLPILLSATVALSISGCAEKRSCSASIDAPPAATNVSINDNRDKQIHALQVAIAEAKAKAGKVITKTVTVETGGSIYPPNAQPGKCYKKVLIPAKFEQQSEKVLASEASEKVHVIPAKYRTSKKKVLVKEASSRLVAVPATYKKVTEKILVKEASERLVTIPAKYSTKSEKVLVREATTNWKKSNCNGGDCGTMCLVTTPAQYRTVTRKVVVQPATTKSVPVPAVYKTVTRTVLDQPATTKSIPIPAIYKTVTVRELVEPAKVTTEAIPETYRTVTKRVQVSSSSLKWQETVCKSKSASNTQKVDIKSLQSALKNAGFNPGPIDGIYGKLTKAALIKYQYANKISAGKITRQTLDMLGL